MQPISDVQFLAQVALRIFNGDQVTSGELNRLRKLGDTGHSTMEDQARPSVESSVPTLAPHAQDDAAAIALANSASRAGGF